MEIEHAGCIYVFTDLNQLVADAKTRGDCIPPGAVKKVAKALGLKPKQVQQALDDAGVYKQLTKDEMIGRVSHMGETFIRFHRRSIDSKGSHGLVYVVRWPGKDEDDHMFVHSTDHTSRWHFLPETPEAKQAQADYLERKRQWDAAEKRDQECLAKVKKALEGMSTDPGLDPHRRGGVYFKNIRQRGSLFDEVQHRLAGIAVLEEAPSQFLGCVADFVKA